MLVLLVSLLLLELSLLDLEYLFVWLPSLLAMQDHVTFLVDAVGDFGKGVVAAVVTDSDLFIVDSKLFPAEIALVDESTNACYFSAIDRE